MLLSLRRQGRLLSTTTDNFPLRQLASRLGLTPDNLLTVLKKFPRAASSPSFPGLDHLLSLGLTPTEARKVVLGHPKVLEMNSTIIEAKLSYLDARLDLNGAAVCRFIVKYPAIFSKSTAFVEPKLSCLETSLSLSTAEPLSTAELRKIVTKQPTILSMSASKSIAPKLALITSLLDLKPDELRRMVVSFPGILAASFESNTVPTYNFFADLLTPSMARTFLIGNSAALSASLTNKLEPRRDQLLSAGVAANVAAAKRMASLGEKAWAEWLDNEANPEESRRRRNQTRREARGDEKITATSWRRGGKGGEEGTYSQTEEWRR